MKTRLKVDWEDVRFTCRIISCAVAAAAVPTEALCDESTAKAGPVRLPTVSFSDPVDIGVVAILGETTAFTVEAWLSKGSAIDAVLGWSFRHDDSTHPCCDYVTGGVGVR